MRERAAEFERMSRDTRDPVIHGELRKLNLLYLMQADEIERGKRDQPCNGEKS
jgi:hypothetical protein